MAAKREEAPGVFSIRRQAEEIASTLPPLLVEAERIANTVAAGLHGRRRAGPGETFWQHRAYSFGDPVTAIDWRQSARAADRLYVRQNEWDAAAAVWIWRDPSRSLDYASAEGGVTKRLRADIVATALASLLAKAGERVGLIGSTPRIFHGRSAAARFLEALDVGAFDERASSPPPFPIAAHSRVVFISDFFTDLSTVSAAAARAAALGAKGALFQVIDAAEETFPFAGRTEFADFESRDRIIVGDAGGLREAYRRAFAAHREALTAMANRLQWTFIAHRTDSPATAALLALYLALAEDYGRAL
ncbi:MAG: DUF58 domain-containing protein [Parvularculaceae bacterium]|nr:DUF58 domain-containing protein [Parvularculaceae bacterium]